MPEFSSLSRLRRSASRARSSLPAVTARSALRPHSSASFLVSAASNSSSFSCAIIAATWARAIEVLSCMSRRIWSIIFSGSSALSIRSFTFARISRDNRSMIPVIDSLPYSAPRPAAGCLLPGCFHAPEQLDVQRLGALPNESLPLTLPVEDDPESIRIFRIFEESVPQRAQSFRPAFAGDLAVSCSHDSLPQICAGDACAALRRCDRGHAEHRAAWLATNEQPLLRLARNPEQPERLWPAIDVDSGIDQKVVAEDRDRVSGLRGVDVRGDDLCYRS